MEIHHVRDALSVLDADLVESRFSDVNLAKSRFDDVNLQRAAFSNANLGEATFANVDLSDVSITDAKLAGMRFEDIGLQRAVFSNVTLREATFTDVDLGDVSIAEAKLDGMRINGILVHDLLRAHAARSGAVLYAKDLARVQAFYQAVLEMDVEHAEDDHVVLGSPGFQLVVTRVPERIAASIEVANPARRRTETPIKLVFWVASIEAARAAAPRYGGELYPPGREWDFQGTLVCDGVDPEGNIVQFRQRRP